MKIIFQSVEEPTTRIVATGKTFFECSIELLKELKSQFDLEREYLGPIFEALKDLTENERAAHSDMSCPEEAFILTYHETE